jgi:heat-inducible transcriptional repressor
MAALTSAGFLEQPHTSAGRVPTERAYRLFLENAEASSPSLGEQEKLQNRLAKAGTARQALKVLAAQLAEVSGSAAVFYDVAGTNVYRLSNVFGQPDLADPHVARYVAELLDQAAEWLPRLASEPHKLAVRIGQENDDFRARRVSVLAMQHTLNGKPAFVAIVGPTRLPYRKAMALFEFGNQEVEKLYGQA